MDLTALLMLLSVGSSLPKNTAEEREKAWRQTGVFVCFMLSVGIVLAGLMGIGAWTYGSPARAWAMLRDESLEITPEFVDCGEGKRGEKLKGTVRVHNWTDEPVLIYGGTTDCSCITMSGLPVTILPNESVEILLWLRVPKSTPGVYTRRVELITMMTISQQKRTIKLRIGCRIK